MKHSFSLTTKFSLAPVAALLCLGCVRRPEPIDPDKPTPASVSGQVFAAQSAYAESRAKFFEQLATSPPATATEAAAACVESDKAARDEYNAMLLKAFAAIDNGGEGDELDAATAAKVFGEMAKGFRRKK